MKRQLFRAWFYLRMGFGTYWSFVFTGINVLTVTYYLAIERAPFLKGVFPTFPVYVLFLVIVGIPLLVFTGFIHYKKIPGFQSEAEINVENNPYIYKLQPGYAKEVSFPLQAASTKILLKLASNEKVTQEDISEINELLKKMDYLINGGYIGIKGRKVSFGTEKED